MLNIIKQVSIIEYHMPDENKSQINHQQRLTDAQILEEYQRRISDTESQRSVANDLNIPRSTLRSWDSRKANMALPDIVVKFFESVDGNRFLHRFLVGCQFVMIEVGGCGIRLVSLLLKLLHLDFLIGSSFEAQRQHNVVLENHIGDYGDSQKIALSKSMPHKKITIVEDETYHPRICLVGIEPVSNFIYLEKYSDKRDAKSWNESFSEATKGLNIEVIQATSDQGSGLKKHIKELLGAHESPDLFHVQEDITKGIGGSLAVNKRNAQKAYDKAEKTLTECKEKLATPDQSYLALEKELADNKDHVNLCSVQSNQVKEARQAIGHAYHPYDIYTGELRNIETLEADLNCIFEQIDNIAKSINLKDTGKKKLKKSKKMVPSMVATLQFYWSMIGLMINSFALDSSLTLSFKEFLIPMQYLLIAKGKAKDASSRKKIQKVINSLEIKLNDTIAWRELPDDEKDKLIKQAIDCANVFQRSSSCVEGRNGYLSLRHHGLHNISDRKLKVLTVIHNYFIKRPDKTTAAERFFEQKHEDLFEYLVEKMPYPPRSGKFKMEGLKMAA
jgi:hypothetical protein